ncbi:MAG: 1-acyl-sn-glycerol-3-phosphate acyltransferase [Xanthomonadales bacterium]|nr:1-acyl-sn-glycerol-3-phosphate acyltransferase [Xanthomonadales bacterium]
MRSSSVRAETASESFFAHRPALYSGLRWRLLYRLPWLIIHLLLALPLAVVAQMPALRDRPWGGLTVEDQVARWWCRGLLRIFGLRVQVHGQLTRQAVLVVANHLSWLDIVSLLSLRSMRFVAKAEISRWPVVGWLVTRARTVYVARGCSDSAQQVLNTMTQKLRAQQKVAIFPEGGVPEVNGVARFRHRLLAAAVQANVAVEPIALRYSVDGVVDKSLGFWPGEHFMANFFRLLGGPPAMVEVIVAAPIASVGMTSRELAQAAENVVRRHYEQGYAVAEHQITQGEAS